MGWQGRSLRRPGAVADPPERERPRLPASASAPVNRVESILPENDDGRAHALHEDVATRGASALRW
jgi:hypothetical protein